MLLPCRVSWRRRTCRVFGSRDCIPSRCPNARRILPRGSRGVRTSRRSCGILVRTSSGLRRSRDRHSRVPKWPRRTGRPFGTLDRTPSRFCRSPQDGRSEGPRRRGRSGRPFDNLDRRSICFRGNPGRRSEVIPSSRMHLWPSGSLGCTPIRFPTSPDGHSEAPRWPRTTRGRAGTLDRTPIRLRTASCAR